VTTSESARFAEIIKEGPDQARLSGLIHTGIFSMATRQSIAEVIDRWPQIGGATFRL